MLLGQINAKIYKQAIYLIKPEDTVLITSAIANVMNYSLTSNATQMT